MVACRFLALTSSSELLADHRVHGSLSFPPTGRPPRLPRILWNYELVESGSQGKGVREPHIHTRACMLTNMYKPACKNVSNLTRATLQHAVAWLTSNLSSKRQQPACDWDAAEAQHQRPSKKSRGKTREPPWSHDMYVATRHWDTHCTPYSSHSAEHRPTTPTTSQGTHSVVPGTHHLGPKAHQKLDFTQQLVPKSPTKSSTTIKHKPPEAFFR
jgi:hypothetical protein